MKKLCLCSTSAFTVRCCRAMLSDGYSFSAVQDRSRESFSSLASYADGILLSCSEFCREDREKIIGQVQKESGGRCALILLTDFSSHEACARDYRGRAQCLNLFAAKEQFLSGLASCLRGREGTAKEEAVGPGQEPTRTSEAASWSGAQMQPGDPFSRYKRQSFLERAKFIAQTGADILLLGESGAGKSWLAEKIYAWSGRRGNFLSESLADIPPALFESELFGTSEGAYTDAVDKMGLLEATGDGTLFLDEIGELPLALQSKLFSVLDRHKFRRVGSLKEQSFCGRLIFATNKDLEQAVREKSFREELYNRISLVTLQVPPLRAHPRDIPDLAMQFAQDEGKNLSPAALEKLGGYRYPGNIRELRNIVRRSCLLSRRSLLTGDDIRLEKSL